MKVFCHNFNPDSDSGPNKFTRQLFSHLEKLGVEVESNQSKCDVEFALIHFEREKIRPTVLRLDGIYFNSDQNYHQQNLPIKYSYETADHIVFQSNFNKALTESWFGPHKNTSVIHNAADTNFIDKVSTKKMDEAFDMSTEIWSCASSWRPHKRLRENLDYFYKKAPSTAVMIVAGSNATVEDLKKYNELTTACGSFMMDNIPRDYGWEKYGDSVEKICTKLDLTPTMFFYVVKDKDNNLYSIGNILEKIKQ